MKHGIPEGNTRSYTEWSHLIDEWIFNAKTREILKKRLLDGVSYDELARQYNYSTEHIKNIIYRAEDELFRH